MKQYRFTLPNRQKEMFVWIFLILTVMLLFMPLTTTLNDAMTRIVIRLDTYKVIQTYVVPQVVRMVGVILYPFGFEPKVVGDYLAIGKEETRLIEVAWNCIGWQSMLFFVLTAWVGFQGEKYSLVSKIKAWMIGFLGTLLVNLLRITIIVLLAYYFGSQVALVFHDYGSTFMIIGWLFFFWWFVYKYVLDER